MLVIKKQKNEGRNILSRLKINFGKYMIVIYSIYILMRKPSEEDQFNLNWLKL